MSKLRTYPKLIHVHVYLMCLHCRFANIDVKEESRRGGESVWGECLGRAGMCVEVKEGKESLHPLTHPPTFVLFWPIFLRLAVFVAGQHRAFLK